MDTNQSRCNAPIYFHAWLRMVGLVLMLALGLSFSHPAHAQADQLVVTVDGREVTLEDVQAQLQGRDASLEEVLAHVGPDPVQATSLELSANGQVIPPGDAQGGVHGRQIKLLNLTRALALHGRLTIWLNGPDWRICVTIVWGSINNPVVTVDGREVRVEGVEAELDGRPSDLRHILAQIGDEPVTADKVELFDPTDDSPVEAESVEAVVQGNHIALTGLSHTLAARGRIGIWISGSNWRICIIITWGSRANPVVTVDGREVTVQGVEAEVDGQPAELRRVLALLGDEPVTADAVELFDPTDNSPLEAEGVAATVKGNQIALTNLAPALAARGRIGIWISGSKWRICIIIVWGSRANPMVTVDGREVTVQGVEAEVDGQPAELRRVLALLGDEPVTADKVELFDPTDNSPIEVEGVSATVQGNQIALTNLAPALAARGRIGIWISGGRWRICIIIVWGSRANPVVTVDGREVTVQGVEAEVDGQPAELRRVLALLGDEPVTADAVDLFDPADDSPLEVEGVGATVQGNQIAFTNLSNLLAARGRIGIWISGGKWRICIIIIWGTDNNPRVVVDGRPVTAYGAQAELDGEATEPRRVLKLLGAGPVTAEKVELIDGDQATPIEGATAAIREGRIELTNVANLLAARGRISIWISGERWRICIMIEWGRFTSADGRVTVELPAREVHTAVLFTHTEIPTPTKVLPPNVLPVLLFTLKAANEDGAEINRFDQPYQLRLHYSDEELERVGIKEESLQIAFFDEQSGEWQPLPTEVDTENNIATAGLDHLTEFALWGEPSEVEGLQQIYLPIIGR